MSLREHCDPGFARWVTEFLATTLRTMKSRVDQVDIVARFPSVGEVRVRYDALTIPIERRDGSRALVCGAIDNCAIDLRKAVERVA